MLYIFSFLIIVLFVNFLVATNLENKAITPEKETLINPTISAKIKFDREEESSNFELPLFSNTFLLAKVH